MGEKEISEGLKHMRAKMIDYLLNNANPSIQYRVKTEVLNQELSAREKDQLQEKILREPIIQSIISCQKGKRVAWQRLSRAEQKCGSI